MMKGFVSDTRGAAFVETLIALPVVLLSFFGVHMFAYLCSADLIMERAASAAARAAGVYLADHAGRYGGAPQARMLYAHEAARRVMFASPVLLRDTLQATVEGNRSGFSPITVRLRADFDCSAFLVRALCGLDGRISLNADATMPYQGP